MGWYVLEDANTSWSVFRQWYTCKISAAVISYKHARRDTRRILAELVTTKRAKAVPSVDTKELIFDNLYHFRVKSLQFR